MEGERKGRKVGFIPFPFLSAYPHPWSQETEIKHCLGQLQTRSPSHYGRVEVPGQSGHQYGPGHTPPASSFLPRLSASPLGVWESSWSDSDPTMTAL